MYLLTYAKSSPFFVDPRLGLCRSMLVTKIIISFILPTLTKARLQLYPTLA